MKYARVAGLLFLVAAGLFLSLGLRGTPRNTAYIGLGVAFLAPFVNTRYFFPFQPIAVSPIGIGSFFSSRGWEVIASELIWIWIPAVVFALSMWLVRKFSKRVSS